MRYGRPMKGKSRRLPVTIHIPADLLPIIDAHVDERADEMKSAYSRSEFVVEAVVALLRSRGVAVDDEHKGQ